MQPTGTDEFDTSKVFLILLLGHTVIVDTVNQVIMPICNRLLGSSSRSSFSWFMMCSQPSTERQGVPVQAIAKNMSRADAPIKMTFCVSFREIVTQSEPY